MTECSQVISSETLLRWRQYPLHMYVYHLAHSPVSEDISTDRHSQLQLAWLIAFVASLIADIRGKFPHFAWWTIAYDFCIICGITIVIAADAAQTYHVAVRWNLRHTFYNKLIVSRLWASWRLGLCTPARS